MVGISAACTCTVDGVSGSADTRSNGYIFAGCGAHVEYSDGKDGAGFGTTWCYVTSPPDCPGESPYIPLGFKVDHTLPEWETAGAAWKRCYGGYRCEAWWGNMSGSTLGEPVVLHAPLDWPDCCALCSNMTGDDEGTPACAGWSFDPVTGSCQPMSTISSVSASPNEWGVTNTIHGYPGYFEPPASGCWGRAESGLCGNMNWALFWLGVALSFYSFCLFIVTGSLTPFKGSSVLKTLLTGKHSRVVKASCLEVTVTKTARCGQKGAGQITYNYTGKFATRAGATFVVPTNTGRSIDPHLGRSIEKTMLSVLFLKSLDPLADPIVREGCGTRSGLRDEFLWLVRNVRTHPSNRDIETVSRPRPEDVSPRFDCLLLLGGAREEDSSVPKVLLVGILGEDRLTYPDADTLGFSTKGCKWSFFMLAIATAVFVTMCSTLLASEAAQLMAAGTFGHGMNYRAGAAIGLVLCVLIPTILYANIRYKKTALHILMDIFPPAVVE